MADNLVEATEATATDAESVASSVEMDPAGASAADNDESAAGSGQMDDETTEEGGDGSESV